MAYDLDGIEQIEKEELKRIYEKQEENRPIIIDVREPSEYVEGHIPGVPLLPMNQVPEVIDELNKDESYVLVCRSGSRSHHTALYFKDNGIEKVKNFAGGMLAWDSTTETGMENPVEEIEQLYENRK
ncbi:Rhodanese-related sulfurtransferase [Alteribacillus persepolensis]|uniref:Rhodanese-related sulfurtransferase n=1 Tax=Alteribacillus persepolensis TaxID=568899 RepID=A0A1G8H4T8_9BACI|nr:rhodanese-like domain-containing protein [Alteribacillus persepolensis]SDI01530.1 Rhodanese-related sulfurtransferase [Alteribacillus persepolensis]